MIVDLPNRESARVIAEEFRSEAMHALLANERLGEGVEPQVLLRLKTEQSAEEKLKRKRKKYEPLNLNDFVGLRILVCNSDQLDEACQVVRKVAHANGLTELKVDDASDGQRSLPYRSIHADFNLPEIQSTDPKVVLGIEVQITTYVGRLIAEISHTLVYKHGGLSYRDKEQERLISLMSRQSSLLENTIAELFRKERNTPGER
ncbi:hypothetical protein [Rhizobium gallicum]|uniref:hypothetical protein n=1 Tax=Rhizobium gallicum TaxID=56730 RepID=UPI00093C8F18|nr:hypothetical protein [Rhizobium gallicum]